MAAKLRSGDRVVVIAGRDKGKLGEITKMLPADNRALVAGVNQVVRHQREMGGKPAGKITKEAPIHLSNLAFAHPEDGRPMRVGFKTVKKGDRDRRVRVMKATGEVIDE